MLMQGRTVLVTGASRGIGAATARLMGQHGASVVINYYASEAPVKELAEKIAMEGGSAIALKADVRDADQVNALVEQAAEALGPIDTLVINANASFTLAPFVDHPWSAFEDKLLNELKGAFFPCKAVVPAMIERQQGCIIAVSSGLSRHPGAGFCAHSTAKSGLDAFIKSLALELGPHNIRANVVSPGLTLTDATAWMPKARQQAAAQGTPMQRNGTPEDVAGTILLLATDEARFVTGTYLPVSGGAQML